MKAIRLFLSAIAFGIACAFGIIAASMIYVAFALAGRDPLHPEHE